MPPYAAVVRRAPLRAWLVVVVMFVFGVGVTQAIAASAAAPAAPTGISVTGSTQSSVSLAWTGSSLATGYRLYRSGVALATTTATTATWGSLNCGSTYRFSVQAFNGSGSSDLVDYNASTVACGSVDKTGPTAPSGLVVGGATQTGLTLSWNKSSDNVGVAGYGVYRSGSSLGSTSGTSFAASGLTCGTSYTFAVYAYDAAGNRSAQANVTGSTTACSSADKTAPTAPSGLVVGGATQTGLTLSWNKSSDNVGVAGYGVYRNGSALGSASGTSFAASGLSCGTSYTFAVDAYDATGNRSAKASVSGATSACSTADTTAPSAPTALSAGSTTATSVTLGWSASTDNVGVSGYDVWVNGANAGATAKPGATVGSLTCGTSYSFAVDAYDVAGNHSPKTTSTQTTAPCPIPAQVVGGSTVLGDPNVESSDDAELAGTAVAFQTKAASSGQASTLKVYLTSLSTATTFSVGIYSDAGGRPGALLGQGSGTVSSGWSAVSLATPVTIAKGASYWIAVLGPKGGGVLAYRDSRGGGASAESSQSSLTSLPGTWASGATYTDGPVSAVGVGTLDTATPPPTDSLPPSAPLAVAVTSATATGVSLSWPASSDNIGVAGYDVYLNGTGAGTSTTTSYSVSGLACGTTYFFSIDAFDAAGNRSGQTSVNGSTAPCSSTDLVAPVVPSGLSATAATTASVSLSWSASTDNVGVTGYTTYANGSKAGTGTATSYVVSGLACGTSYSFAVDAYDAAGNHSSRSNTVNASTSTCPPPPTGGAGLYLSPSGSDSGSCTQAAPCKTFDRAFHLASAGTNVYLVSGDYGRQSLTYNASLVNASSKVVFQPAAGATPSMSGELSLRASAGQPIANVEFDNLTVADVYVKYVQHVIFRNVNNTFWFIRSSNDVSFIGGSSGGDHYGDSDTIGASGAGEPQSTNILLDGVRFHDFNNDLSPGTHQECIFIQDASYVTIRNSTFVNCRDFDIYANVLFATVISNITIDGNHFGITWPAGYYAFRANVGSFAFHNNSWEQGMSNDAPVSATGCGNTVSSTGFSMPSALLKAC